MKIRVMINVSGKVQGVSFRYFTREKAIRHNTTGWVKNLPSGNVMGCIEGEDRDVMCVVDWCRTGPTLARVDGVEIEKCDYTGEFKDFTVKG